MSNTEKKQGELKRKLGVGAALAIAVGTTVNRAQEFLLRLLKWQAHPVRQL